MSFAKRAKFDTLREVAFGAITANYARLGDRIDVNPRIVGLNNQTDADIYISFDGVKNNIRLSANSYKVFDITANKSKNDGFFLEKRKSIFIKYVSDAATSGDFWVELIYGA